MRSSIVSTIHECYCGWVSLELLVTWFKEYNLLFPNYTSAFISSFNCLYQRDHNVIYPKLFRVSALKLVKFYKNTRRLLEYCCRHPQCCCHDNNFAAGGVFIKTEILSFVLKQKPSTPPNLKMEMKTIWELCLFQVGPSVSL